MKKDIVIYGAGGLGREIVLLIDQINKVSPTWRLLGFLDDSIVPGTMVGKLPVLGDSCYLKACRQRIAVVLAIGDSRSKRNIFERLKGLRNIYFPVLIHPSARISALHSISVGEGSVITAGNVLTCDIQIGRQVLLNLSCTIGHDVIIEDFCSIMPGVHISGAVTVKEASYIGTGAVIINGVVINERCIIGAGAVVTKMLPSCCTAVGVPAKPVKFHE